VRHESGERNGVHEQANGRTREPAASEPAGSASDVLDASDVPAVTPPVRRAVRRGGSRPAGPPVNATHDG